MYGIFFLEVREFSWEFLLEMGIFQALRGRNRNLHIASLNEGTTFRAFPFSSFFLLQASVLVLENALVVEHFRRYRAFVYVSHGNLS